jgi:hypothetical protein
MVKMLDTIGDRQTAANEKNEESHQQGPEIKFLAVTEGMGFVCRLLPQMCSEDKQRTVAGVDQRMNAFGKHCGGSTEGKGNQLGHGDGKISQDGSADGSVS